MTEPEIVDTLTSIFRKVLANDTIALSRTTAPAEIPNWDSFRYVDIILRVEEAYGITIRPREANKAKNVGDLIDIVMTKVG